MARRYKTRLEVAGALDALRGEQLSHELTELIQTGRMDVVLDLGEVRSIDPRAVSVLLVARGILARDRRKLVLHPVSATVRDAFDSLGVSLAS